jgi:carboxypeptidase Taq
VRAVNRVRRTLVRSTADEASYNLHVIMRFELERELVYDAIDLERLPKIWNERVGEYLGLDVPSDVDGVLQEIHWASSLIGYFPTYALGNIMAVQIWERAQEEIPDLDGQVERAEFAPLREWLRLRIHQHGRKSTPKETLQRAVGNGLDAAPYLR